MDIRFPSTNTSHLTSTFADCAAVPRKSREKLSIASVERRDAFSVCQTDGGTSLTQLTLTGISNSADASPARGFSVRSCFDGRVEMVADPAYAKRLLSRLKAEELIQLADAWKIAGIPVKAKKSGLIDFLLNVTFVRGVTRQAIADMELFRKLFYLGSLL